MRQKQEPNQQELEPLLEHTLRHQLDLSVHRKY